MFKLETGMVVEFCDGDVGIVRVSKDIVPYLKGEVKEIS